MLGQCVWGGGKRRPTDRQTDRQVVANCATLKEKLQSLCCYKETKQRYPPLLIPCFAASLLLLFVLVQMKLFCFLMINFKQCEAKGTTHSFLSSLPH